MHISHIFDSQSTDEDSPYSFFTLNDLYYSGILDHRNDSFLAPLPNGTDFTTGAAVDLAEDNCRDLKRRFNIPTKESTMDRDCAWSYKCTQNHLHFPSFHLEAVLNKDYNDEICERVTIFNKRFVRTPCEHDSSLSHWLKCDCGTTVVAYI